MLRRLSMGLSLACLVGCATASQVSQRLDSKTGVTFTFSSTPMILYRDAPAHAANARNFVSLGPLQANRSGRYEYFIWLGIWTTNHSVDGLGGRDGFDSIVLFADGEPLTLDLSGWTPDAVGASDPIYLRPVATALDAYYQVTADQIRLIAEADVIALQTTGFASRSFEPWDKQAAAQAAFRTFLQATN